MGCGSLYAVDSLIDTYLIAVSVKAKYNEASDYCFVLLAGLLTRQGTRRLAWLAVQQIIILILSLRKLQVASQNHWFGKNHCRFKLARHHHGACV